MEWLPARVVGAVRGGPVARTIVLDVPGMAPALAGQHIDVRLTADDGYTAQRSYSLASPAGSEHFELTVDKLDDGEVSPYLVDELQVGHLVEARGPIGHWFTWTPEQTEPVQLIAGGSGVVPLMSMVRTHAALEHPAPFRLLQSVRAPAFRSYRMELGALAGPTLDVDVVFTRQAPPDWHLPVGRLTRQTLAQLTIPASESPTVYVCGTTGFVETVADALLALGHAEDRIRTERFGPTG